MTTHTQIDAGTCNPPPSATEIRCLPGKFDRLDFLDTGRALAILLVFAFHCLGEAFGHFNLTWNGVFRDFDQPKSYLVFLPLTLGWCGVPIFFSISGFCINQSWLRSKPRTLVNYLHKRFFRIYPPYLFALCLSFMIVNRGAPLQALNWSDFALHALLVHNFSNDYFFSINPSFWSIAIECQLYLLFPIFLIFASRFGWMMPLIVLCIFELIARLGLGINESITDKSTAYSIAGLPILFWFSWSTGAALSESHQKGTTSVFSSMDWKWLTVGAVACSFYRPVAFLSFFLFSLATTAWIADRLEKRNVKDNSSSSRFWKYTKTIGICSYSLYLIHQPMLQLAKDAYISIFRQTPELRQPILIFLFLLCTSIVIIPLSHQMYRWIELPSISLGHFFKRKKSVSEPITSPLPAAPQCPPQPRDR